MLKIIKKLYKWFISFFKWLLSQLKDRTTIIIFIILTSIAISPIVLGYLFGFILHSAFLIGIATGYLIFWMAPGTPVFTIIIGLTLAIRKIIKIIRKENIKNEN